MSKIKYCSLDEAWGSTINPQKNQVHFQEQHKELNDNPLRTPNINYECSGGIPKVENDYYLNVRPTKKNDEMYENMDPESQELFSFIDSLGIPKKKKDELLNKIKNVFENISTENISMDDTISRDNTITRNNSQEHFQNPYYNLRNDNKPTDILFLILLGVFLIFIMDKK